MDRAPAAVEEETGRAPAAPPALELRVLEGPQRGARNALAPGRACVIAAGTAAGADIVLHDEGAASLRVTAGPTQALVEVLHGEVTIGDQTLAAGAHAVWPRWVPLRIGASLVAFGCADDEQWAADAEAPAGAEEAAAPQPLRRRAEVWLGATGAAILLACGGTLWMAHVAAAPRPPGVSSPPRPAIAAPRGDDALEREVAEVFRVNGVTVRANSVAPGHIVVEAAERDGARLRRRKPDRAQPPRAAAAAAAAGRGRPGQAHRLAGAGRPRLHRHRRRRALLRRRAAAHRRPPAGGGRRPGDAGTRRPFIDLELLSPEPQPNLQENTAMTTPYVDPSSVLAAAPLTTGSSSGSGKSASGSGKWFEAMAQAWGEALDRQADIISEKSDIIATGNADSPSAITELTTEALKMGFLSQNAQTSISTGGQAFETLARKG